MRKFINILNKVIAILSKIVAYIVLTLLLFFFLFKHEVINELQTNDLIIICTLILIEILMKDEI